MKNFIIFLVCSLYVQLLFGQPKPNIITFFDKNWKQINNTQDAYFYRLVESKSNGLYLIKDLYYNSDMPYMTGTCLSYSGEIIFDGSVTWYYENGNVSKTANYIKGEQSGEAKEYYENGLIRKYEIFSKDKHFICQYWNETGKPLLIDGNGFFKEVRLNSRYPEIHYEIEDSLKRGSYITRLDKKDTIYIITDQRADFDGGLNAFYKKVEEKLKYPIKARRAGIEGKIYIEFIIDVYGNLIEPVVVKGIGEGCDEVALSAVKKSKPWIPAKYKGKPVNSIMVLPITFKLG